MSAAKRILQEVFGFPEFRGEQEAIIERVLNGGHSLVLMPTGMGKSLCYQIPSRLRGFTLVISPLIALMKDQVDQACRQGLRCCYINSSLNAEEREDRYHRLGLGEFELVYVTPERFRKGDFLQALQKNQVQLLAIDEAHCISQWGHDFRPDFTRLKDIRALMGDPTTMALTATATPDVQRDIVYQLGLDADDMKIFNHGLARDNLWLAVEEVYGLEQKIRAIVGLRHRFPGPTIVYFSLIANLEKVSHQLQRLGLAHWQYHGKLADRERKRSQDAFYASSDGLILATPAFGLGVNKPDIRSVIHAEMPGSIEAYYQEVGRAGRDGKPAHCVLLHDNDDAAIQMDFIKWANPEPEFIRSAFRLMANNPDKFKAEGIEYLRDQMNFYNRHDFRVETALNLLERWGCIEGEFSRGQVELVRAPEDADLDPGAFSARLKSQQKKLLEFIQMLKPQRCRRQSIYSYFGLEAGAPCGQCDVCHPEMWRDK